MKTTLIKPKLIIGLWFLFLSTFSWSQEAIILSGSVSDAGNQPIIGATVSIQGQTIGVLTDVNGEFQLKVNQKLPLTLVVSYIGFESQEIDVYENEKLSITLPTSSTNIKEVVITTGYTSINQLSYSGAVDRVQTKQLDGKVSQSFDQLLGGQASGVNIIANSGELNTPAVVQIRGINSITSGIYPLIIIDGVPVQTNNVGGNIAQNPLGDINPDDIESLNVLKDAAATAQYGSRAANGVLVITTKKGSKGKVKINYNVWSSYSVPYGLPKLLGAQDYVTIKNEGLKNLGDLTDKFLLTTDSKNNTVNTNWEKVAYNNGFSQNHDFNVSGANENTAYYLSANFSDQNGIIRHNQLTREAVRLNIEHKLWGAFNIGVNFSYANTVNAGHVESGALSGQGLTTQDLNREIITLPPNVAIYNANGTYNVQATTIIGGGTSSAKLNSGYNSYNLQTELDLDRISATSNNAIGNIFAELDLFKGLKLRSSYGVNYLNVQNYEFQNAVSGGSASIGGSVANSSNYFYTSDWVNTIKYDNTFAGKHNLSLTLGNEAVYTLQNSWGATRSGLTDPSFNIYQGGYTNIVASGNSYLETGLVSFFANLNYDFSKRYLLGLNIRQDGYSGLPTNNKWGTFSGFSAGWNISEENFFKQSFLVNVIDNLKIFGSYGEVGNTSIGAYPYQGLYAPALGPYAALNYNQAANNNLKWETSYKTDLGLTLGVLKNRLSLSLDYFNNNVDGLILDEPTTPSLGLPGNNVNANAGSLYNRGVEFSLNAQIFRDKNFKWTSNLNFSTLENKVTAIASDYYTPSTFGIMNLTRKGYSLGSIWAVPTIGVDAANGNRIFVNASGQNVEYNAPTKQWIYQTGGGAASAIDNYKDGKILGPSLPTFYGGFNNTFTYRGFDLNLNFNFAGGNKIYDGNKATESDGRYFNSGTFILNRWQTAGQKTDVPKITYGDNVSNGFTISNSYYVENGDYLKLKNAALGYTINLKKLTKYNLSSVRIYAQASNIFTITPFQGGDPEISQYGNNATNQGYTRNSVANSRTYSLGLNVSF